MNSSNREFWDKCARFYTSLQEKKNQNLYQILVEQIALQLHPHMTVLELGCGTGQLSLPLASFVKEWLSTDFSQKMILELKKRNMPANLCVEVQDATHLPYESERFDVVLIANTLHIMPEPEKALQEAHRVLKGNGLLIAPTFLKDERQKKFKLWVMERLGFQIYHNWTVEEFYAFVEGFHFSVEEVKFIPVHPSSEYLFIARR